MATLPRAAEMLEDAYRRCAPAGFGEEAGQLGRRLAVIGERDEARARRQMKPHAVELPAVNAQADAILERPDEAGGGEAEGARARQDDHLRRIEISGEQGADAVAQRVAARQHGNSLAAPSRDRRDRVGQRAFPCQALARDFWHQRQVAGAADDERGTLDEAARGARQAAPAILAQADDGEPGGHGAAAKRIHRGGGKRAAAAPSRQRDEGNSPRVLGQRRFGLGRADKADGEAQHQRRPGRARRNHLQEMKQRRRRSADRDHRAAKMTPPQLGGGGRAGGAERFGQRRHAPVVKGADRALADDPGRDHRGVGDHGGACLQGSPPGRCRAPRPHQIVESARSRRWHGSAATRPAEARAASAPDRPRA